MGLVIQLAVEDVVMLKAENAHAFGQEILGDYELSSAAEAQTRAACEGPYRTGAVIRRPQGGSCHGVRRFGQIRRWSAVFKATLPGGSRLGISRPVDVVAVVILRPTA